MNNNRNLSWDSAEGISACNKVHNNGVTIISDSGSTHVGRSTWGKWHHVWSKNILWWTADSSRGGPYFRPLCTLPTTLKGAKRLRQDETRQKKVKSQHKTTLAMVREKYYLLDLIKSIILKSKRCIFAYTRFKAQCCICNKPASVSTYRTAILTFNQLQLHHA